MSLERVFYGLPDHFFLPFFVLFYLLFLGDSPLFKSIWKCFSRIHLYSGNKEEGKRRFLYREKWRHFESGRSSLGRIFRPFRFRLFPVFFECRCKEMKTFGGWNIVETRKNILKGFSNSPSSSVVTWRTQEGVSRKRKMLGRCHFHA